jgi:nitroreductase
VKLLLLLPPFIIPVYTMSDVLSFLQNRNSSPKLAEPAPDPVEMQEIFKVAMRAPDHAWLHPWRFITVREERREALGQCWSSA